jgi:iron complex outermembrane recepter protein
MLRLIVLTGLFLAIYSGNLQAQRLVEVNGRVTDSQSGAPISGANITVGGGLQGTVTNADGHFKLNLASQSEYQITARFIGYDTMSQRVFVSNSSGDTLTYRMVRSVVGFDELIVIGSPTGSGVRYQADMALNGEALNRKRDVSIGQMLDGEPGVAMRSIGPAPARPVIRGLDGERILVLENGERMGDISESAADHAVAIDPQAMDRLEIIRGPASLLYGNSALGGVVNLITSDIPVEGASGFTGNVALTAASVNNFGSFYTRMGYGGKHHAVTGRISIRGAGDMRTPQGPMTGSALRNLDTSLGYGFGFGNTTGGVSLMAMESSYGIPADPQADESVEIQFNRFALQGNVAFRQQAFFDRYQIRYHISRFSQNEVVTDKSDVNAVTDFVALKFDQSSVSTSLNIQHRPVGIADRGALGFNINGRIFDVGGEDAFSPGDQYLNVAIFTFQEFPLTPQARLQAGVRSDFRTIQTRENQANPGLLKSRRDHNLAGSLGLNVRVASQQEFGFSMARAHRYPSVEELYANGVHLGAGAFEIGNPDLGTEVSYGTDIFYRWRSPKFELELTGFLNAIQDFIIFQPAGVTHAPSGLPVFRYESDDVRLVGGEFTSAVFVTPDIRLQLGMDYVNGTRLSGGGSALPFMPPLRLRIGGEYNVGRGWTGLTLRHVWAQNRVAADEETTNGYTLLHLQGGLRLDGRGLHRFVVRIENVMNTIYQDHLSRIEDRQYPMPARNITVSYNWNF